MSRDDQGADSLYPSQGLGRYTDCIVRAYASGGAAFVLAGISSYCGYKLVRKWYMLPEVPSIAVASAGCMLVAYLVVKPATKRCNEIWSELEVWHKKHSQHRRHNAMDGDNITEKSTVQNTRNGELPEKYYGS